MPGGAGVIERITHGGIELAIILRAAPYADGIEFYTGADASLQIGRMCRPEGYVIKPHVHLAAERSVSYTQEALFIRSGRVEVNFYDATQSYLESRLLNTGDVILLMQGGHGFRVLEPSDIVEVKQGPYVGEHDKRRFTGVEEARGAHGEMKK